MNQKITTKNHKPGELRDFIKKYGISQPLIAQAIGMNINLFRSKLYQSQASYFFTDEEYITIMEALEAMAKDIRRLIKRSFPGGTLAVSSENMAKNKKNSEFRV